MSVEELNVLKKILGRLPRTQFSSYDEPLDRLMDFIAPPDHLFIPELTVTDSGTEVEANAFVYYIKADQNYAPCMFNLDRPVTGTEYSIVFPGIIKVIGRNASKLYLKAPLGHTSKVTVEMLRAG